MQMITYSYLIYSSFSFLFSQPMTEEFDRKIVCHKRERINNPLDPSNNQKLMNEWTNLKRRRRWRERRRGWREGQRWRNGRNLWSDEWGREGREDKNHPYLISSRRRAREKGRDQGGRRREWTFLGKKTQKKLSLYNFDLRYIIK